MFEGVREMGSSERHSRTQNREKSHIFELLPSFEAEGEVFLSRIVTADETWVHNFVPEKKAIHGIPPSLISMEESI
jgi:hypothetical protein